MSSYFPKEQLDKQGRTVNITDPVVTTTLTNLTISTTNLIHTYNAQSLLLPYSAAIFATAAILLTGFYALWSNGVSHTSSFSGLVRTTRNKDLDNLVRGHCLGSEPVDKRIAKRKLQYGLLVIGEPRRKDVAGNVRHAAFGFPETVTRLRKGDQCL